MCTIGVKGLRRFASRVNTEPLKSLVAPSHHDIHNGGSVKFCYESGIYSLHSLQILFLSIRLSIRFVFYSHLIPESVMYSHSRESKVSVIDQ